MADKPRPRGAIVKWEQLVELARLWYPDPRDERWAPRTRDENQAILARVGLTGSFWDLPG